jgi:lipopolysaccharide/colanic/teichoic acid biosynthesis glycosyltransferase/CTP:molybdopterin cytidylyltransferase MocA
MKTIPNTAVVLAGSLATFHGLALAAYPKILLPLANRPLVHYQAGVLAAAGVTRLILCVQPGMGEVVTSHLGTLPDSLQYLVRETSYGTGGSLKEVADALHGSAFWVMNGDLLLSGGLAEMLAWHQERRALATVGGLKVREAPWEMERVEVDADQQVRSIHRIHPAQERRSTLRPAGLYLFQAEVLDYIPESGYFDLKEQLFAPLYHQGARTAVWELPGYSRTITSVGDFFSANLEVLNGRVPLPDPDTAPDNPAQAEINASARVFAPVVVGSGSEVGAEAIILGPSAIGSHCEVERGAVINECVVLDNARIRQGAYLHRCVICAGGIINNLASFHEMAVMQTQAALPEQTIVSLREHARRNPAHMGGALEWQTDAGTIYQKVKRGMDVFLSLLGLIITAPIMLAVAMLIKLDSPGEVIFRQERCGQGGHNFTMYKFRSMLNNAEDLKRELQDLNEVDGPMFKIVQDPRITRVGRFIRDTNLDELPQLWNVLKGDMSMVGPRPLSLDEMRYNPKWRDARLSVRPGMTGLWQVEAHTNVYFNDWIINDLEYVKHCSLWLDVKIMVKTMKRLFREAFGLDKK